jgi:hypothetical protein
VLSLKSNFFKSKKNAYPTEKERSLGLVHALALLLGWLFTWAGVFGLVHSNSKSVSWMLKKYSLRSVVRRMRPSLPWPRAGLAATEGQAARHGSRDTIVHRAAMTECVEAAGGRNAAGRWWRRRAIVATPS